MNKKIKAAIKLYNERQSRDVDPDGTFDRAGRWYPSDTERCSCCRYISSPTRSYPYSYMTHCRSSEHVANVCDLNNDDKHVFLTAIKQQAAKKASATKKANTPRRIRKTMTVYKSVAVTGDWRLVSIYDGQTEYQLNKPVQQKVQSKHCSGLYAYESINDARCAVFPRESRAYYNARVILKCKATGEILRYGNKLAVSKLVPVEAYAC